jgi:hypothetical protein
MLVRSCSRGPRAGALAVAVMLALVAGCSKDDTVTGPGQGLAPDGAEDKESLESDLDVRASALTHYADGYVLALNPTSASYNAGNTDFAFNRSGGAITITRQGTGTYTVRFAGLSAVLGSKSTVHVTGFNLDNSYCKPANQKLLSDVVHIKCFSPASGGPTDTYYSVYITRKYGSLAFAFADKLTSTDYAPPASASHNPSGAIRVFRSGVGTYAVRFAGFGSKLTSNGGHAQAVAIGTGAQHCSIGGWGGSPDLTVNVRCYSRDGVPKDVKFNLFFATPSPNLAYAWADQPATASYSPSTYYRSNPSGGAVTITRFALGRYKVVWSGLAPTDGGDVQVTAYGPGNIVCKVEEGFPVVRCFDPSTNALVDSAFDIMYFL